MKDSGKSQQVFVEGFPVSDPVIGPENALVNKTDFISVLIKFSNNKQKNEKKMI